MQIQVKRQHFNPTCTLGEMFIDGVFFAYTLEDTFRNLQGDCSKKVPGQTCIDPGTYDVVMSYSPKHGRDVPHLQNVPCFQEIEIHAGNTDADTLGCILIGANTDNVSRIWQCADVVEELYARITEAGGASITIE